VHLARNISSCQLWVNPDTNTPKKVEIVKKNPTAQMNTVVVLLVKSIGLQIYHHQFINMTSW
jgi:hypothetical protein